MRLSPWEVIILKPTRFFLTFLTSQIPNFNQLDFGLLLKDNTAYTIAKQENEEQTLDEIERHFTQMFRFEICRWLGPDARNDIELSFLDFLCCFKFELHAQIIVMEKSITQGSQLLRVQPRAILLKWMKLAVEDQRELVDILEQVNLSNIAENATVIVKNFPTLNQIKPFLTKYYKKIVQAEMSRMCSQTELWPPLDSYEQFCRYFTIDIHTKLIHLS